MTGIYSDPVRFPGKPENAMRARAGLRPLCFNRPDFPPPMSPDCKTWSVHPQEDPAAESVPGREGWRCWGCPHLPTDPRVIERARLSECATQTTT
jgi:hypothetical protein